MSENTAQLFHFMTGLAVLCTRKYLNCLKEGKISVKSPIAKALMNKKKGDIVEIRVPAGMLKLRIDDFQ